MSLIDKILNRKKDIKLQKGVNAIQNIYDESDSKKEATQNAVNKVIEEIQLHPDMPVGSFLKMLQERTDLTDSDLVRIVKQMPDVKSEEATIEAVEKLDLSSEAIREILQDAPVSPITAQQIAKQIPDETIQKKQQAEIEQLLEKQEQEKILAGERKTITELNKLYNSCENINDSVLVEQLADLNLENASPQINEHLKHIIAKKIALNYMQFGGPKLPTMMRIMPAVDMLEQNLPGLIETEYQKAKTDYDEKGKQYHTYGKQEKQMVKQKILENIAKKVAQDFKEIGDINVPQIEQLRNLSPEELKVFIHTVQTFCSDEQLTEYDIDSIQKQLKGETTEELQDLNRMLEKMKSKDRETVIRDFINSLKARENKTPIQKEIDTARSEADKLLSKLPDKEKLDALNIFSATLQEYSKAKNMLKKPNTPSTDDGSR